MKITRRKVIAAGSAVALTGAIVTTVALATAGHHTETSASAAGPGGAIRAQHVADSTSPQANPPLSGSQPPSSSTPSVLDLTVLNSLTSPANISFCLTNTVESIRPAGSDQPGGTPGSCTPNVAVGQKLNMDEPIAPGESAAHLVVNSTTLPSGVTTSPSLDIPVNPSAPTTACARLSNTAPFEITLQSVDCSTSDFASQDQNSVGQ